MAVLAVGMARLVVDTAFAASGRVAPALRGAKQAKVQFAVMEPLTDVPNDKRATCYIWAPARLLGHPADFRLAHQTAEPITTILLLDDDVTTWTFHGLSIL